MKTQVFLVIKERVPNSEMELPDVDKIKPVNISSLDNVGINDIK